MLTTGSFVYKFRKQTTIFIERNFMKLGTRIFLCYILVFGTGFYYLINWVLDDLRIRYVEGVEETLVDQANIMASFAGHDMTGNQFDPERLRRIFDDAYVRRFSARIYKLVKKNVDLRIYITDKSGRVVFDSKYKQNEGSDYALWRDVYLTLRGKYGARSTRQDPDDPSTTVLHVAAPIFANGSLAGVLTVAKPTTNINIFIESAKSQVLQAGIISVVAVFMFSIIIMIWLTLPVKRLTRYANDIRDGKRAALPKLDQSEIGEMGKAFENMREALEGKKYVEKYVQTLTHEIKSPLSAIRGAAELLEEDMPSKQRSCFLSNIRNETSRIQNLVDRMLELSVLENRKMIQKKENISFKSLVTEILEGINPILSGKRLELSSHVQDTIFVRGDPFLLKQAVSNLVLNAADFSPVNGRIELSGQAHGQTLKFTVQDNGPGIPDYALEKIFERFFSLQRPDTGKKSTGLGLNFVREVAMLHNGEIRLENRPEGGVRATLSIPLRI